MTIENEFTTIQVSKRVHKILQEQKIIKQEPFNTVIERLITKNDKNDD